MDRLANFGGNENTLGRNGHNTQMLSEAIDDYILDAREQKRTDETIRTFVAEAVLRWAERRPEVGTK